MYSPDSTPQSPTFDPWEPAVGRRQPATPVLTSIEVTATGLCNLRCEHCAVGEVLVSREADRLPLPLLTAALDRVDTLTTLSVTGGEPTYSPELVHDYVLPLLAYARRRGLWTQLNTNLSFGLDRYLPLLGQVDVLHISWNYRHPDDLRRIAFGHVPVAAGPEAARRLYDRMLTNATALAGRGMFISAESMMTADTLPALGQLNRTIAAAGCRRHEVHPRYPVDWARHLEVLDLDTTRAGLQRFLDERDPGLWVLLGTFPFFACSPDARDRALLRRLRQSPNVSIRNDPDGRSRLNVSGLTGDVMVTDFGDVPPLGNIQRDDLNTLFAAWQQHPIGRRFGCCCPEAGCLGPNPIVAETYYADVDFRRRRAVIAADDSRILVD